MNLFKDSGEMQRDWQIAGWSVTPKIKTRKGESTRNNNEKTNENSGYGFRTAESFLNNLNKKNQSKGVDLSQYQAGTKVYHKKFGEGTINYVEPEGDDLKVDINFDKFGHKRLMAKFANLEII